MFILGTSLGNLSKVIYWNRYAVQSGNPAEVLVRNLPGALG